MITFVSPRIRLTGFLALLLASGCSVFDEDLIPRENEGDVALAVADNLSCSVPLNDSLNDYRIVDMGEYGDNISTLPNCLGEADAPGNDAFFRVRMTADEKWHFHVRPPSTGASDPAIYVLSSCSDLRSCQDTYWGVNACGDGEAEHFSFIAPSTGDYFVGIDGLRADGERVEVFAVNAQCGNGVTEHSESCDDSNDDPLDRCHECHPSLFEDGAESEPNDGPLDPNILFFPDGTGAISLSNTLGTRCDFDFFQVEVPENARLEVTLEGNTSACRQSDLQIRGLADPNPFRVDPAVDPNAPCATVTEEGLPAGTYLVRVASHRELGVGAGAVDYGLRVEISAL